MRLKYLLPATLLMVGVSCPGSRTRPEDTTGTPSKFWTLDLSSCSAVPEARTEAHTAWFELGALTAHVHGPPADGIGTKTVNRTVNHGFLLQGGRATDDGELLNDVWLFDAAAVRVSEEAPRYCPWTRIGKNDPSKGASRMGGTLLFKGHTFYDVLELGCGLGLPAIVAASRGARVVATDNHPHAGAFLAANRRHNRVELTFAELDWRDTAAVLPRARFDRVIASDLLYSPELAPL